MMRRNIEQEARLIDDLLDVTRIAHDKLHCDHALVKVHRAPARSMPSSSRKRATPGSTLARTSGQRIVRPGRPRTFEAGDLEPDPQRDPPHRTGWADRLRSGMPAPEPSPDDGRRYRRRHRARSARAHLHPVRAGRPPTGWVWVWVSPSRRDWWSSTRDDRAHSQGPGSGATFTVEPPTVRRLLHHAGRPRTPSIGSPATRRSCWSRTMPTAPRPSSSD